MRSDALTRLRDRLRDRGTLMQTGMTFLAIGLLAKWLFHPHGQAAQDVVDAASGVLVGMSLACLLLGLRMARPR